MIDLAPLVQIGLLLVRPGFLIAIAACFGGSATPPHVKIGLTVLLAAVLLPSVPTPQLDAAGPLVMIVAREAAIGVAIGLAANAFVAAVEFAGHLSGFQIGLSYGAVIDPQSGVRNNLVASLYGKMAVVAFLLVNGHHAFVRTLSASYQSLPIGVGQIAPDSPAVMISLLGLIFSLGVRLAAPLVLVLILCEVAMALLARTAPALNLMVVGAPVRLFVGLLLLGVLAPAVARAAASTAFVVAQLGSQAAQAFR